VTTIAQGGMGYVELVFRREERFLRWCARKRLHQQYRSDASFRSMFLDEARLAGLIHHPNAVGVLDVGADEEGAFFIMEFVEGVPLSRVIGDATAGGRSIPMQVAVRVCMDAARGLHAAHEVRAEDGTVLHLVHRDVSPQNILVGFDGTVRVTDFGIAKALGNSSRTSAGVLKGNMGYLAPEQLRFEEPDRRSDLFSLGVTLYEMLTGHRLYPNTSGFDGTRRILTEPAPDIGEERNDVPPELCELLFELLAKDRTSRPATAAESASRLEGVLAALIADEGSMTVADYMDAHFADARQRQRAELAAHLTRIESQSTRNVRSLPQPSSPAGSAGSPAPIQKRLTVRPSHGLALGSALAAVVAISFRVWSGQGPAQVVDAPRSTATVNYPPRAVAALANIPATGLVNPIGDSASISDRGLSRVRRKVSHGSARRLRTVDQETRLIGATQHSGPSDQLSVPFFEHWQ
jgi:serine/threonine protein kinase